MDRRQLAHVTAPDRAGEEDLAADQERDPSEHAEDVQRVEDGHPPLSVRVEGSYTGPHRGPPGRKRHGREQRLWEPRSGAAAEDKDDRDGGRRGDCCQDDRGQSAGHRAEAEPVTVPSVPSGTPSSPPPPRTSPAGYGKTYRLGRSNGSEAGG